MWPELRLAQALLLGLLHGPAELVPVSSSAHTALVPRLLGWDYERLPADARKAFEVALHAGSLAGLLVTTPLPRPRTALLATLPPALAGALLERPIEERLGGPRATAVGLLTGSALLLAADALAPTPPPKRGGARVAAAVGVAQALALAPGLSRLGMAVAAGRLCGLPRAEAFALARQAGLPVLAGATALKGARIARDGLPRTLRGPLALGAAAAFASTLAAAPLARRAPVRAAAAERALLAVGVLWKDGRR
jgi:undecaprenyl-diphosphatase